MKGKVLISTILWAAMAGGLALPTMMSKAQTAAAPAAPLERTVLPIPEPI
ncbi:MAG: hypothetical protein NTW21_31905 [Verrucomicrobia bacterium]|nr:hypothetical protein [Verrucomicrobiota bacterium]